MKKAPQPLFSLTWLLLSGCGTARQPAPDALESKASQDRGNTANATVLSERPRPHQAQSIDWTEDDEPNPDPDEYKERILASSGKERVDLLESFEKETISENLLWSEMPEELRFSDAMGIWSDHAAWGDLLAQGDSAVQLVAARVLWQKHSRLYSKDVLSFLAQSPSGDESLQALRHHIENSLQAEHIRRELDEGDYSWGAWLAFLRPHPDLVPTLLEALNEKPDHLPETVLALGKSGDRTAFEPLMRLLKSDNWPTSGYAAKGLGYLGIPEAEPHLLEVLASDHPWVQVNACQALSMIGTRRALPSLERLANDERWTGVLNVRDMARVAFDTIAKRERP